MLLSSIIRKIRCERGGFNWNNFWRSARGGIDAVATSYGIPPSSYRGAFKDNKNYAGNPAQNTSGGIAGAIPLLLGVLVATGYSGGKRRGRKRGGRRRYR